MTQPYPPSGCRDCGAVRVFPLSCRVSFSPCLSSFPATITAPTDGPAAATTLLMFLLSALARRWSAGDGGRIGLLISGTSSSSMNLVGGSGESGVGTETTSRDSAFWSPSKGSWSHFILYMKKSKILPNVLLKNTKVFYYIISLFFVYSRRRNCKKLTSTEATDFNTHVYKCLNICPRNSTLFGYLCR